MSNNIGDIKESLAEIVDVDRISKAVIVGHFVLYGFNKKTTEFTQIIKLIEGLAKESVMTPGEIEEM